MGIMIFFAAIMVVVAVLQFLCFINHLKKCKSRLNMF